MRLTQKYLLSIVATAMMITGTAQAEIYQFVVTSEINFLDKSHSRFPTELAGVELGDTVQAIGTFDSEATGTTVTSGFLKITPRTHCSPLPT